MITLQYRVKESFYLFGEKLVSYGDSLFYSYLEGPMSFSQSFKQKAGLFLGDFGCLIHDTFRLSVYKAQGQDWKIVYVGDQKERPEIEHLFFSGQEIKWEQIEQVSILSLGKKIKEWLMEGNDFVITQLCRSFPSYIRTRYNFKIPLWVNQVIKLPKQIETLLGNPNLATKRKQVNKLTREGYTFKLSKDPDDLAYFYNELYSPNVQKSYGTRAKKVSLDDLYVWLAQGGLLFIMDNDKPVAGSIFIKIGDSYVIVLSGVLDEVLKKNVKSLLHWTDITCAAQQGASEVDFGGSRPWTSDGVFEYKRRWEAHVRNYEPIHDNWHFYSDGLSFEKMKFINQIGFITKFHGKFYNTVINYDKSSLSQDGLEQLADTAKRAGLHGTILYSPFSKSVLNKLDLSRPGMEETSY